MRKVHLLGLALLAIFAFSVVATATASAELFLLAEWLYNGAVISGELLVESPGELLLEDNKVPILGKSMILCSGIFDGFVGPGSADLITELLNLSKESISTTGLSGLALECVNQENCPEPLFWAVNLPWTTELELHEDPGPEEDYVVLILGKPGWEVECMGLGQTDTCAVEPEGGFLLDNGTPTPTALFSEEITELMGLGLGNCTLGGAATSIVEGEALIEHPEGGTISASSGA
jgi:hypothetical protein